MPRRRVDKATARKANLRRKQMKAALNAFLAADTDGSGEVELEELIVILPAGTDRTAAEALMKEFDADGDGGLDRAEFIRLQKHLWAREDSPPRLTEAFVAQRGFRGFHPGYIFTTRRGKTGYYVDADRALGPGDALAALAARLEGTTSESQALVALAATLAELHRAAAATSAAPGGDLAAFAPLRLALDVRSPRAAPPPRTAAADVKVSQQSDSHVVLTLHLHHLTTEASGSEHAAGLFTCISWF
jgi:hypothetical protein